MNRPDKMVISCHSSCRPEAASARAGCRTLRLKTARQWEEAFYENIVI